MNIKKVVLVIVDISGYTQFIRSQKLSAIHVEEIVFELLGAVIDHAAYPLTLNKLEGDAAFLYAEINADNQTEVARNVARQVYEFFKVFMNALVPYQRKELRLSGRGHGSHHLSAKKMITLNPIHRYFLNFLNS